MTDVQTGAAEAAGPQMVEVASYTEYAGAQHAVDFLSDAKFPVEFTQIVGHDVSTVEQVTGRLTNGRAAGYGAATGAWFGLFVGLLVGIVTPGLGFLGMMLLGLVIGAVWGAVFGFVGHYATGGRRDFSSSRTLVANRYSLMVEQAHSGEAKRVLADLRWPSLHVAARRCTESGPAHGIRTTRRRGS